MSRPSSRSHSVSPHAVLPPIIANEKDRTFLINLNSYIDHELSKIDKNNPSQRYIVYKTAFDQIIEYVNAYKPLLTAIKSEYEETISTIQRGQREAFFLAGKVKAMTSELSTIHNYRKRAEDLDQKMIIIQGDNDRLEEQLKEIRASRALRNQQRHPSVSEQTPPSEPEKDVRQIPGLSVKQSTDISVLQQELERLDGHLKELRVAQKTRYLPKETKARLKEILDAKVTVRDTVARDTEIIKQKRQKLKVAVEAAHGWMKIQPPVQTIGEACVSALNRANRQGGFDKSPDDGPRGTPSTTFEEDDPGREKEAEIMLEYIEKFNELMEDGLHNEAAVHAANSPKSILRTPETLNRFKALGGNRSPSSLLIYCEALMSTVPAYKIKPNEYMSTESVKCALAENRLDLLGHWIAQERMTLTEEIGDMIFARAKNNARMSVVCLALAQQVYVALGLHKAATGCMVRQGRINQAVEYASQRKALSSRDYCVLLHVAPSAKLGILLVHSGLVPLRKVYSILMEKDMAAAGLEVILSVSQHGAHEITKSSPQLREAVFADKDTLYSQWEEIATKLNDAGHNQTAVELLAAATVFNSIQSAAQMLKDMQESVEAPVANQEAPVDNQESVEAPVDNQVAVEAPVEKQESGAH